MGTRHSHAEDYFDSEFSTSDIFNFESRAVPDDDDDEDDEEEEENQEPRHIMDDRNAERFFLPLREHPSETEETRPSSLAWNIFSGLGIATSFSTSATSVRSTSYLSMLGDSTSNGLLGVLSRSIHLNKQNPVLQQHQNRPRILGMMNKSKFFRKSRSFSGKPYALSETLSNSLIQTPESRLDEFRCPICLDFFHKPSYTPCRHVFCSECILLSLLQQSLCPLCRAATYAKDLELLTENVQNQALTKLLSGYSQLIVQCTRCSWIGSIKHWEKHLMSRDCSIRQRQISHSGSVYSVISHLREESEDCGYSEKTKIGLSMKSSKVNKSEEKNNVFTLRHRTSKKTQKLPTVTFSIGKSNTRKKKDQLEIQNTQLDTISNSQIFTSSTPSPSSSSSSVQPQSTNTGHSVQLQSTLLQNPQAIAAYDNGSSNSVNSMSSSFNELASWILDNHFRYFTKLYTISHSMENVMGAIISQFSSSVYHAQAILEISTKDSILLNSLSSEGNSKIFVSMELFGDSNNLHWEAYTQFPTLKYTALEIQAYFAQGDNNPDGKDLSVFIDFLMKCRSKKYSLLGWNCQSFISDLKHALDVAEPCNHKYTIPRPKAYSQQLVNFLYYLDENSEIPVLPSSQNTNSPERKVHSKITLLEKHINYFQVKILNKSPKGWICSEKSFASAIDTLPQPKPYIRTITLCLFPIEDLHRASLWPIGALTHFIKKVVSPSNEECNQNFNENTVAEKTISDDLNSLTLNNTSSCFATDFSLFDENKKNNYKISKLLDPALVRLRYKTCPVLLFHVQKPYSGNLANGHDWKSCCYLSLEFRSDLGLWWHVYKEYPPGLLNENAESKIHCISESTSFPLKTLIDMLASLSDKEYHPTTWSGWDFTETVLEGCCPEESQQILHSQALSNLCKEF